MLHELSCYDWCFPPARITATAPTCLFTTCLPPPADALQLSCLLSSSFLLSSPTITSKTESDTYTTHHHNTYLLLSSVAELLWSNSHWGSALLPVPMNPTANRSESALWVLPDSIPGCLYYITVTTKYKHTCMSVGRTQTCHNSLDVHFCDVERVFTSAHFWTNCSKSLPSCLSLNTTLMVLDLASNYLFYGGPWFLIYNQVGIVSGAVLVPLVPIPIFCSVNVSSERDSYAFLEFDCSLWSPALIVASICWY